MPIAKADFDQLMNEARVTLVGASDAGLKGALYNVLTEFLNDSSSWTQSVQVNAVTTRREYPLQVPEGQIIRLVGVSQPSSALNGQPVFIPALMPSVGTLFLSQAPATAATYEAEVVTNVSLPVGRDGIPGGPDWLLPIWHNEILDGLLGRMMMQPGKSYTDKGLSAYHLKRFRDGIARARVSKLRAKTNGAQAWRFPQQFRTTNQRGGIPSVGSSNDRTF